MMVHKRRAKKFYNLQKKVRNLTKKIQEMFALNFDFMQNLHLPGIPVDDVFYLWQLMINVFSIHNLKDNMHFIIFAMSV